MRYKVMVDKGARFEGGTTRTFPHGAVIDSETLSPKFVYPEPPKDADDAARKAHSEKQKAAQEAHAKVTAKDAAQLKTYLEKGWVVEETPTKPLAVPEVKTAAKAKE